MQRQTNEERKTAVLTHELVSRLERDHPFYSFKPHEKQMELLKNPARIRAAIGANRTGKSEIIAYICACHFLGWCPALTREYGNIIAHPGKQSIWVVSPDANVSRDVAEDKIRKFLPDEDQCVWKAQDRVWKHPNGNTLGFKSCDSGREKFQGTTRTLIAFDEEPNGEVYNECYARTIDCGGRLMFAFTPLLGSIWLHDYLFNRPDLDIYTMSMGLIDNPYIPRDEIEIAKKQYSGDELRIRVYGDYILRIGTPFFDRESLDFQADRARDIDPSWVGYLIGNGTSVQKHESEYGHLTVFKKPKPGRKYALGVDVASGDALLGDFSCIQVLDTTTFEQVAIWHGKNSPGQLGEEAVKLGYYYNTAMIAIETNSFGLATQVEVERAQYGNIYVREMWDRRPSGDADAPKQLQRFGWNTDLKSKRHSCAHLKDLLLDEKIFLADPQTVHELRSFGYLNAGSTAKSPVEINTYGIGAVSGHDDRVMSLVIAVQCALQAGLGFKRSPDADKTMHESIMEDLAYRKASTNDDDDYESWDYWDDDF